MTTWNVLIGDAIEQLRTLPDQSVQTCVTSPPYWGLRSYLPEGDPAKTHELGAEPTPDEYVANMVAVFREVWRVLRDDGTLWLNLGDSYAGTSNGYSGDDRPSNATSVSSKMGQRTMSQRNTVKATGLKPKDLVGIPWRVAFALQADGAYTREVALIERAMKAIIDAYDGYDLPWAALNALEKLQEEYEQAKGNSWYLRSDIIWAKTNPMPEIVTDRPTKAHEYLFLLTKSARYYYDAEAIKEPTKYDESWSASDTKTAVGQGGVHGKTSIFKQKWQGNGTRNKRSVWTVSTKPYSGSHYAVFPPDLIEPCILAGTSARGQCPDCGSPWERVVKRTPMEVVPGPSRDERSENGKLRTQVNGTMVSPPTSQTVGWKPTCDCRFGPIAAPVPQTVLDPFVGSGTTLQVAIKHNRNAIGIDLDARNAELINERMSAIQPVLIAV